MDVKLDRSGYSEDIDSASSSPSDRRVETRHTTLLQIAKLVGDHYEELCILRDVSATGLRAESYWPVREGEEIAIEFRTGRRVDGKAVWIDGKLLGMQFDMAVPVSALLDRSALDQSGHAVRKPRLRTSFGARLRADGHELPIQVCNVSQAGLRIRADTVLKPDSPCEITLDALGRRLGQLRWYKDGEAGIMLANPLNYTEFGEWRLAQAGHRAGPGSDTGASR